MDRKLNEGVCKCKNFNRSKFPLDIYVLARGHGERKEKKKEKEKRREERREHERIRRTEDSPIIRTHHTCVISCNITKSQPVGYTARGL